MPDVGVIVTFVIFTAAAGLINANLGLTITTGQTLNVGTTGTTSSLNVFGLITANNGLTVSSGNHFYLNYCPQ